MRSIAVVPTVSLLLLAPAALAQSTVADFQGTTPNARFGFAVSAVGDVNADGAPDFLIGAPQDGALMNGALLLYSGSSHTVLWSYKGYNYERTGWSVAGPGDVDGDGVPDLAVGAVQFPTQVTPGNGSVKVFSGASKGVLWTKVGSFKHALGLRLASIGDVNGDGAGDLLAGTTMQYALVLDGATGAQLAKLSDAVGNFAEVLGPAGDVNHDGAPDYLVGAVGSYVRLYSGATHGLLKTWTSLGADSFGSAMSGVGDVNGDGYAEVAIGASGDDTAGANFGALHIYSGFDYSELSAIYGTSAGGFGSAVAPVGDVDADAHPDYAVSAPADLGVGRVFVVSGATAVPYVEFAGPAPSGTANFGNCLAAVGDANGDFVTEILAGAYTESTYGNAHLLAISPVGTLPYGTGTPGCAGFEMAVASATPSIGNAFFGVHGDRAPSGTLGILLVTNVQDFSGSDPFGIGVKLHVGFFGASEAYGFDAVANSGGAAQVALPLPNNPSLVGLGYFAQFVWAWPGSTCSLPPYGLSSSRGLSITIQG